MIHIVLYRPEIPPNTGNIARLCAGTQIPLHLIRPLGFSLEDRYLKRAGLDYWQHVPLSVWDSLEDYLAADGRGQRLVATSARRGTMLNHFAFTERDSLLFGPETTGLPPEVYERIPDGVRIPTRHGTVRSLNLSTCAGIVLYQALFATGAAEDW